MKIHQFAKPKVTKPDRGAAVAMNHSPVVDEIISMYKGKTTRTSEVMAGLAKAHSWIEADQKLMPELLLWILTRLTEDELNDVLLICKGEREKFSVPLKKPASKRGNE